MQPACGRRHQGQALGAHAGHLAAHFVARIAEREDHVRRQQVRRPEIACDVAVLRRVVQLLRRAELRDVAVAHQQRAIGQHERVVAVMRHADDGQVRQALVQRLQFAAHRCAQVGVERRQRLVEQQHVRLDHECARQRDALLHPARQLRGQVMARIAELHELQRIGDAARHFRRRHAACAQPECDVLEHRQVREQRVILEQQTKIALVRRRIGQVASGHGQRAGQAVGLHEPGDEAQQRGLAAAALAEHGQKFTGTDRQRQIFQHRACAVAHAQVFDLHAARRAGPQRSLRFGGAECARMGQGGVHRVHPLAHKYRRRAPITSA